MTLPPLAPVPRSAIRLGASSRGALLFCDPVTTMTLPDSMAPGSAILPIHACPAPVSSAVVFATWMEMSPLAPPAPACNASPLPIWANAPAPAAESVRLLPAVTRMSPVASPTMPLPPLPICATELAPAAEKVTSLAAETEIAPLVGAPALLPIVAKDWFSLAFSAMEPPVEAIVMFPPIGTNPVADGSEIADEIIAASIRPVAVGRRRECNISCRRHGNIEVGSGPGRNARIAGAGGGKRDRAAGLNNDIAGRRSGAALAVADGRERPVARGEREIAGGRDVDVAEHRAGATIGNTRLAGLIAVGLCRDCDFTGRDVDGAAGRTTIAENAALADDGLSSAVEFGQRQRCGIDGDRPGCAAR